MPLRQTPQRARRAACWCARPAMPASAAALIRERRARARSEHAGRERPHARRDPRDATLATPRLTAVLLSVFAALALLVTMAGITGVIATSVSQRTQEFGVRMALGASRARVLGMVLGQGLMLVAQGSAIGIVASLAATRVLSTLSVRHEADRSAHLRRGGGAFLVAGALACLGPAWRATTVDPMLALRAE